VKTGFYFRNKSCFTFSATKELVEPSFQSVIDYGDILYMHETSILCSLDSVYYVSLCFITNAKSLTPHCILYDLVCWTSLTTHRQQHWYVFIYKALFVKLLADLCTLLCVSSGSHQLRSSRWLLLMYPGF